MKLLDNDIHKINSMAIVDIKAWRYRIKKLQKCQLLHHNAHSKTFFNQVLHSCDTPYFS